jgi:actin
MDDEVMALVIDNGTRMMKAGFAGDDAPRAVWPTIVGRPRHKPQISDLGSKDWVIGDEGSSRRGILNLYYPMRDGLIDNWDDMEKMWHHTFYNELRIAPEEHPVLFAISPLASKLERERMTQTIFDCFTPPGISLQPQGLLSLYASGRVTGLSLDMGEAQCTALPVYEGHGFLHALSFRSQNTGKVLSEHLHQLFEKGKHPGAFVTRAEREILRDIKEKLCFLSPHPLRDQTFSALDKELLTKHYELPDGTVFDMDLERLQTPEILFDQLGHPKAGIHHMILEAIQRSPSPQWGAMFSNIVASGGSTMFPGFGDRLTEEMKKLVDTEKVSLSHPPASVFKDPSCSLSKIPADLCGHLKTRYLAPRIKVIAPPERKYSVWIGGSILASLSTFQNAWITKEEYEEIGPTVVDRKCY